jgi:hypothetical protein
MFRYTISDKSQASGGVEQAKRRSTQTVCWYRRTIIVFELTPHAELAAEEDVA